MTIRISAIIPAYNCESTLGRALDSILDQTCQPDEIIIVNDGSTDKTAEVIADYTQRCSRIQGVFQENAGPAAARNHGAKLAKNDWISFLDSDDAWYPWHLENLTRILECHPELSWATAAYDTNKHGKTRTVRADTSESIIPYYLKNACRPEKDPVNSNSVLVHKAAFEACGGFHEGWYREEDTWLWFHLGLHNPQLGYSPVVSSFYQDCPESITNQRITIQKNLSLIFASVDKMLQEAEDLGLLEREDVKAYFGARVGSMLRKGLMLSNRDYKAIRAKYRKFIPYANLTFRLRLATWLSLLGLPVSRFRTIVERLGLGKSGMRKISSDRHENLPNPRFGA